MLDDDDWVHPSWSAALGLGATTLHATQQGLLTAFAPHYATSGILTFGRGEVRPRLEVKFDAVARSDSWAGWAETPEGQLSWQLNAGSAAIHVLGGVQFR